MVEQLSLMPDFGPKPPEEPVDNSAHLAAVASQRPILEYEDHTSEAARDQGHGPQERGVPLEDEDHPRRKPEAIAKERADRERRRRRVGHRENRYTDIGKDTDASIAAGEAMAPVPFDPDTFARGTALVRATREAARSKRR